MLAYCFNQKLIRIENKNYTVEETVEIDNGWTQFSIWIHFLVVLPHVNKVPQLDMFSEGSFVDQ